MATPSLSGLAHLTATQCLSSASNEIEAVMQNRLLCVFICLLAFPLSAQKVTSGSNVPKCPSGNCTDHSTAPAPMFPSHPVPGKWEVEDFKSTNSSISCAVMKYDVTSSLPILHLLCPGPQIFAPLRVHLTLSFADVKEIPKDMHDMLVDFNRAVRFKSKSGESQAELTLHAKADTQTEKMWVKFTKVNVGIVLPDGK
jgi:hypothetical protein